MCKAQLRFQNEGSSRWEKKQELWLETCCEAWVLLFAALEVPALKDKIRVPWTNLCESPFWCCWYRCRLLGQLSCLYYPMPACVCCGCEWRGNFRSTLAQDTGGKLFYPKIIKKRGMPVFWPQYKIIQQFQWLDFLVLDQLSRIYS